MYMQNAVILDLEDVYSLIRKYLDNSREPIPPVDKFKRKLLIKTSQLNWDAIKFWWDEEESDEEYTELDSCINVEGFCGWEAVLDPSLPSGDITIGWA